MLLYLFLWILLAVPANIHCLKVSFYGASYIAMPLQEAKISTNIRLKFRTQQENALIFLAAGRTDYCLLRLKSARLNFQYKINENQIEIWSPKKIKLDDLMWHDVSIQRYETNITMQIDEHFVRKSLHPNATELNIHFGTFVGGVGDFSESYVSEVDSFRGCISDVYYNNVNVLKRAKEKTGHVTSVSVSWTCSPEFDADVNQGASFLDESAFMLMARTPSPDGELWNFNFRTIELNGMIFYNGGTDFMSLTVEDQRVRLLASKGSNVIELLPDRNISDGNWHHLILRFEPKGVELILDDVMNTAKFADETNTPLKLDSNYYFGGIEESSRRRALYKGVRTGDISFKGCIRNISVNNLIIGFPHMKITSGVNVGCVYNYPCLDKMPCILSSSCRQYGVDEFICYCDQAYCLKADYSEPYKVFSHTDSSTEIALLAITPMDLLEGESSFISTAFIDVLFDYAKFGLPESAILFNIVQQPKHGQIIHPNNSKTFSLIDLSTDKVKYKHNGMENFNDHIMIDLQIQSGNRDVPDYFLGKHRFALHANITPVNDAPLLTIPSNKILRITQGIPKILSAELLNAFDPDSSPNNVIYTISMGSPDSDLGGTIEVGGKRVTTFSQSEINQGLVTYLVNTSTINDISFEIIFLVSDGIETSQAVYLPVSVHPLQLRMVNNTGLIMIHKSSALITPWNLSILSNSDEDNIDVRYDIIQQPQYGFVQKLRSVDSTWITVETFTSSQVVLGLIRYYHNIDFPPQDEFKFTASFGPVKTQKYDFRITFTRLKIEKIKHNRLESNGMQEVIISNDNLLYQTMPLPTFSRNIIYRIMKPPRYGLIYVEGHPKFAKEMDSFTQLDIDRNLIRYKTHRNSYSKFIDNLSFMVSVTECDDVYGNLNIIYQPEERLSKRLSYQAKENIHVLEGGRAVLSRKHFEILFNAFNNLTFIVTESPKHGTLCQYKAANGQIEATEVFTLDQLFLSDIYYCHDNTESTNDTLELLILSDEEINIQYVSQILVKISLVNDNPPSRMSGNTFYIVRDETKQITINDLYYVDTDVETNQSDIVFTHVSCANGEFYKDGIYTDQFTQEDVNEGRISFKHSGPDFGTASFIITDRLHETSGELSIHASEPFIDIPINNASIVQEGKYIVLTKTDISVKTNLNHNPEDVYYKVPTPPANGVLKLLRHSTDAEQSKDLSATRTDTFTLSDVENGLLVYWNTEVASMEKIKYEVTIKNVTAKGETTIRIYPAAYWELLTVKKNQTLFVEESTSAIITRDILEIVHPKISPGDITYLVTSSPQHGYLEIQSITSDDEYNCKVFDQSTINSEKMFYIQAGVNQSSDNFSFDVTNGITWLRNLMLRIIIIPENLYIHTHPVMVVEGKTATVYPDNLQPFSEYFKGKVLEYKIVKQPAFGYIMSGKSKINRFTQKQLSTGAIQYVHNGSENSTDSVSLIAIARAKESSPFDLPINVSPVNDEVPLVVTNTGLQVWNGGKYVIRSNDIMAQDYDSPPENLTFLINHIYGGYLAHIKNPSIKLDHFTQRQIDNEEIYFIHDADAKKNEINFIVTDGLFNTTEQTLFINVNAVNLHEIHNEQLHVFPMTRKQILPEQLLFKCSDEHRVLRYIITVPPQLGRILYENMDIGQINEVTEFEQDDIMNGRILYEHTAPMLELKTNDSFVFDVTADKASQLFDQKFDIEISVSSGGLLRFLPVSNLQVDEGGSAVIQLDFSKCIEYLKARAGMLSPELYIEAFKPQHGIIELRNTSLELPHKLRPNDFSSQSVYYVHDHSDTLDDSVLMSIFLVPGNVFLCNLTIPVTVNPINDQPFVLVTQTPHMTVIQGENRTITENELRTEDKDTYPEHIVYDVINGPTTGTLMKLSIDGSMHEVPMYTNQFTQYDINRRRVFYVHYGKPQSTTFYFKVSDGKFKPIYEIFNINIQPVSISENLIQEPIRLQQGSNSVQIEPKHLSLKTNVHRHRLMYNITNSPLSGIVLINHQPTLRFDQKQLEQNQVSYMQTDITKPNDTFQVNCYIQDTTQGVVVDVRIIVDPFIKINPISVLSGEKIRLTTTFGFDSPILSKLNRNNPKIFILKHPRHGILKKIIRSSGEIEASNNREVNSFTYKELRTGSVYYVSNKIAKDINSLTDSFDYMLSLKTVQPALDTVQIEIHTYKESMLNGYGNGISIEKAHILPINYIVVISCTVGLVLLILVLVLILKIRNNIASKNDVDRDLPPSLPRPPNFLPLNNNRLYSSSDGGESFPVTAASTPLPGLTNIPHCKVIPVGIEPDLHDIDPDDDMNVDMAETQRMTQDHYNPYMENDDWSSSCDMGNDMGSSSVSQHQQSNNPLLRRNQYWV